MEGGGGGVPSAKSILEKPLKLLTEEDISQLTREDCRKFLKDKGMRRPSWNKSQAIQQVLSLKALFEPGDDSGAAILRKILVSHPPIPSRVATTPSTEPSNEVGACGQIPFQEDDIPCLRRDSPRSAEFSGASANYADTHKTLSPRSPAETSALAGQMTIFYSGKVNVYDGVPPEKARSIMHFAANPVDFPETGGVFPSTRMISRPVSKENMVEHPHYGLEKANASRDSDAEGQANREVSLQRYREKRKERRLFKIKKAPGVGSSSLEVYLNRSQPLMNAAAYSQNLGGGTGGELQSPQNQTRSPNLSVDLNCDLNSEDI